MHVAVPREWAESDPPAPTVHHSRYCDQLGDPLLAEFVDQALAANLDLAQSAARLEQALAQLVLARAGYLPQVTGSSGVRRDFGEFTSDGLPFSLGADAS